MSSEGLYGSNTATNLPRVMVAELIGTFLLVLSGTAVAVTATLDLPTAGLAADSLSVALAFGMALVALVCTLGHISGCHLNPAVTIGLAVAGKFPLKYVLPYVAMQLTGALMASVAVRQYYGQRAATVALLGVTQPADGVSDWKVFFVEMTVTFFLVLVIIAVATDDRVPTASAGLAVGFTLAVAIMVAGPLTGGAVNPARAIGPMMITDRFDGIVSYILGPVFGGILAALVYDKFLRAAQEPSEAEA